MVQHYLLALDLGTTKLHAATIRSASNGELLGAPAPLSDGTDPAAPALVFVREDGTLLYGKAAEASGTREPARLVREFTRLVGDDTPLLVGGSRVHSQDVLTGAIAHVVESVTAREGARPIALAITYPASWGPHRTGAIRAAVETLGLDQVELVPEPEASVRQYEASQPLEPGCTVIVYDLGGTTFDATLLRKDFDDTWTMLGTPLTSADLGAARFDDAVLAHVLNAASSAGPDESPPASHLALWDLRRECGAAKESLSVDPEVVISHFLSGRRIPIRLTRSEFESMVDNQIDRTCDALEELTEGAGLAMGEVDVILLVGGGSRTPRAAQRLSESFDRPIVLDPQAGSAAALGAARVGWARYVEEADALPGWPETRGQELTEVIGHTGDTAADRTPPVGRLVPTRDNAHRPSHRSRARRIRFSSRRSLGAVATVAALMTGGSLSYSLTSALSSSEDDKEQSVQVLDLAMAQGMALADHPLNVAQAADSEPDALGLKEAMSDPAGVKEAASPKGKSKTKSEAPLLRAFTQPSSGRGQDTTAARGSTAGTTPSSTPRSAPSGVSPTTTTKPPTTTKPSTKPSTTPKPPAGGQPGSSTPTPPAQTPTPEPPKEPSEPPAPTSEPSAPSSEPSATSSESPAPQDPPSDPAPQSSDLGPDPQLTTEP